MKIKRKDNEKEIFFVHKIKESEREIETCKQNYSIFLYYCQMSKYFLTSVSKF